MDIQYFDITRELNSKGGSTLCWGSQLTMKCLLQQTQFGTKIDLRSCYRWCDKGNYLNDAHLKLNILDVLAPDEVLDSLGSKFCFFFYFILEQIRIREDERLAICKFWNR